MSALSSLRKAAQTIRHAPVLRSATPLWSALRRPYLWILNRLGSRLGIAVAIGGIEVRIHPDFATQGWESVEVESYRAFAAMLRAGDVVYDVGAHIGTYTLVALQRIGPDGRVIAYEPHAFTRSYLERHVEWNGGAGRTLIRGVCCGASAGRAKFYSVPNRAEGMNGLVPVEGFGESIIELVTLDLEVSSFEAIPNVIKIDVEGAEWEVLKGAEQTLLEFRPRIALSLHPEVLKAQGISPEHILEWLAALGYGHEIVSVDHEVHVIAAAT